MMEFDDYLQNKKIDLGKFKEELPKQYVEWHQLFNQIHPESFTQQKLFLINKLRRKYPLTEKEDIKKPSKPKMAKPKIKPLKPKTK